MRDYRIRLRLTAPTGTPWQSDTVFGHLAWQVARGALPDVSLEDFLAAFRDGSPPFVLSDGFPGDLLPRPFLPVAAQAAASQEEYKQQRERRKSRFVTAEDFASIRQGNGTTWKGHDDPWERFEVPHASLNRVTETTTGPGGEAEGGAFFQTELMAIRDPGLDYLSLYLRAEPPWAERVAELLEGLSLLGFGRDRSVGIGAFEVQDCQPWDGFSPLAEANGFVSLSSYCPAATDPTRGRWRVRLKYGKLGENAGGANPFKRPLIQFEPGAVFWTDGPPQPFYGRAVTGLAPGLPEAIQCCYTLAVPCVLPEDAFQED
ncbi:MAG: hypothetical protein HPY69_07535 [Armatimonadetes bacterium]|nr:hypothetical protein [Armatimonadota bacterium]